MKVQRFALAASVLLLGSTLAWAVIGTPNEVGVFNKVIAINGVYVGANGSTLAVSSTGTVSGNAATATALAANPADCSANTYATTIAASGALTCASITNASTTATSANTASAIVARGASGEFTAGIITTLGILGPVPTAQAITAGATVAADACGGVKRISSASALSTGTTNTFTAPGATNTGCVMNVCNANASDAITLDNNALFESSGAADVVLAAKECVAVGSDGSVWRQLAPKASNHA